MLLTSSQKCIAYCWRPTSRIRSRRPTCFAPWTLFLSSRKRATGPSNGLAGRFHHYATLQTPKAQEPMTHNNIKILEGVPIWNCTCYEGCKLLCLKDCIMLLQWTTDYVKASLRHCCDRYPNSQQLIRKCCLSILKRMKSVLNLQQSFICGASSGLCSCGGHLLLWQVRPI